MTAKNGLSLIIFVIKICNLSFFFSLDILNEKYLKKKLIPDVNVDHCTVPYKLLFLALSIVLTCNLVGMVVACGFFPIY